MKVSPQAYVSNSTSITYAGVPSGHESEQLQTSKSVNSSEAIAEEEVSAKPKNQDILILSEEGKAQSAKAQGARSVPQDASSELAQRLVAAMVQFEVRQVIADINKNLMPLRAMAAEGNGKEAALARSYVKRLEKLLRRGERKIGELNDEDKLRLEHAKLKQQKQKALAEEIKADLRKKQMEREARERGYLLDDVQEKVLGAANAQISPDYTASEAAIAARAEAIAAAEMAVGVIGLAGGVSVSVSAESAPTADMAAVGAESGGEAPE